MSDKLISIVIPVYNEEKHIQKNIKIIHDILNKNGIKHNFILVDDGSRDNTWGELKRISLLLEGVLAIKLSRNFGKEAALCAGLEHASSDACIVMDSDLQHPPEKITEMVYLWENEGFDIVECVKASRGKESITYKLGSLLFYNILNKLSGFDFGGASDFKLLDKKVVDAWKLMSERNTFFRGMSTWVGYKKVQIPFVVAERMEGSSKWSPLRLVKLAVNAITSFSSLPLYIVTFLGILFLLGAIPLGIESLYMYFKGHAVDGFTTVILLLLIIGSILMISLGIIGSYIAKIYEEVKQRPRYLVAEKVDSTVMSTK
ncbi:MAG TPA: glycosyltransferase family 2 protein [Pseudobacteroides sp.]|uniref:glycosyltransferase family 2 protein n=1 Tax=Pseudobacteroides sp. TaxID=1968840 RepID=UPI002F931F3B